MKFEKALKFLDPTILTEGIIQSLTNILKDLLIILFGNIEKNLDKGIDEKVKESKLDTLNLAVKNFNESVPKVELNKTYNTKTTLFMDVYLNLNAVSPSDKELINIVDKTTPNKVKFTILGYGKRKTNPKPGKETKEFNFVVVGNTTLSNNDIKEYIQNIFENTFNKKDTLGINLKVDEVRGNFGTASVTFNNKVFKTKEELDDTKKLTQEYILPKKNSPNLPSITFNIAEVPGYPSKLYFKFNFASDILDKQNNPIITKGETFKKGKDLTPPKVDTLNNVLIDLTNDINNTTNKNREIKYILRPLRIHKEPNGAFVVSNGYVMVDDNWLKK